jgi:sporulation protein YlmC with PRC-barrel domain
MRIVTFFIIASLVMLQGAMAQERGAMQAVPRPDNVWKNEAGAVDARALIGALVKNDSGLDVGKIEQLMMNPRTGRVTHAVVAVGSVVALTEHRVVVPWSEIRLASELVQVRKTAPHAEWVATIAQAALDRAPRYDSHAASSGSERSAPAASPATSPRAPARR